MKRKAGRHSVFSLMLIFGSIVFVNLLVVFMLIYALVTFAYRTGMLSDPALDMTPRPVIVFLMVLVSFIIGAGTSLMASLLLTRPIGRIVGAMRELASGNYKARLSFGELMNRNPTMKEITDSFNTMADELDHTEILRSDFINNFSHEFKTPIVSIAGFAKLLKRGNLTDEEKAEYTDIIEEESLRLSEMATNVLNLTKIENQTILTGVTRFNVSEQIRSCVLLLEEKWTGKELELSLDFDEYYISANEELLRQVWINLLDNAVKFADRGGEIRVSITRGGDIMLVSVANTGSTVLPEERERIFRKFYQTDKSHSVAGSGIGLAVVREIVELHKGSVSVSGETGLTVFTVALPCEEK